MVRSNLKSVLIGELKEISPTFEDIKILNKKTEEILKLLKTNIQKHKINAEVFVGGSFAKNTLIKKQKYDIDIFIRFDKKCSEEKIASLFAKIVPKEALRIHGSRDYFVIKNNNFEFEIIPTIKIKEPSEAKNITDLSYFHVKYVKNKINKKIIDEIRLAKAFIHYSDCYGAESYINGFSGYAVELLIIYYKSFIKFINSIVKSKVDEKIILDPAKLFKNKQEILRNLNESKLNSPIILIDPTFRDRNALAALSLDTFIKFKNYSSKFLKKPSSEFFRTKDKEQIMKNKYKKDLFELIFFTNKQAGDIAGTKLKKFSRFFLQEVSRYFDIKNFEFIYDEKNNAGKLLFAAKQKKKIIFSGPPIIMKERFSEFRKEHKNIKIINGKTFAYEKSINFKEFFDKFLNEKSQVVESMYISDIVIKKI